MVEQPGKINIDSVCMFKFRSIQLAEPTTLSINPSPAIDELNIDITNGVRGTMKLELIATDDRVIYTDMSGRNQPRQNRCRLIRFPFLVGCIM